MNPDYQPDAAPRADDDAVAPKRDWHAPTIEEIDYTATEANLAMFGGADLGIYSQ